ncbi:MAG: glycosyltransferase family 9 protein [Ignavibacteriaceae bacterium]
MQERLLIIQTAFIGDAILTLPLIQELKKANPERIIDVITIPKCMEIFKASPYTDNVISFDKRGSEKSFPGLIKFAKKINVNKYDKLFCLHRSLRSAILSFIIKAGVKAGFSNSSFSYVFNLVIEYRFDYHEVRRNLSFCEKGYDRENWRILPEVKTLNSHFEEKLVFKREFKKGIIAIAPGSVWQTKKYPLEDFLRATEILAAKDFGFVIIGDSKEAEAGEEFAKKFPGQAINFCGKLSILESIELLGMCRLLITNDSAPTHFGMAAGIKVLTIYTSTVPNFGFYPYNWGSDFMGLDDLDCKPCGMHGYRECPKGHFNCAKMLKAEMVAAKAEKMVDGKE